MRTFADGVLEAMTTRSSRLRCLLLDASATHGRDVAAEMGITEDCIDLLSSQPCLWRETASPVLLALPCEPLPEKRRWRLHECLITCRYANCWSYIESDLSPSALTTELAARAQAILPDGLRVLLRYFDGRVMPSLLNVLNPTQRAAFLACSTKWAWADRRGWWIEAEPEQRGPSEPQSFDSPLVFDETQQSALVDAAEADAMVDLLLNQGNGFLMKMTPPDQYDAVSTALEKVTRLGIDRLSDQAAFCSLWLELGGRFVDQEPWLSGLIDAAARKRSFADIVSAQTEGSAP